MESDFKYRAFISYSHQDQSWAQWLHEALESYRVPSRLVGQTTAAGTIPARLVPMFRDRDELPSATDLTAKVNEALAQSAAMIVVCSPRSASSRWVNEEILVFKRLRRSGSIFCLIVDGEPNASDIAGREAEECFAPALRFQLDADGQPTSQRTEPIAADARPGKDGKGNAKLKLIAGLLDVGFDVLKQRELHRRNRRMAMVTALALVVMVVTTTLAITAVIARHDAERRQKQAETLVNFMLGNLTDKLSEVQRLDILEAVDNQAMQYFQLLPTTDVTDDVLQERAKALEKIGRVRMDQGHLPAAMEAFQAAAKLSGPLAAARPDDTTRQIAYSRVLAYAGMTDWSQGKLDSAQQAFEAAQAVLQRGEQYSAADPELIFQLSSIENNIGHVLEARGKLDEADTEYRNMLAQCKLLVGGKIVKTKWMSQMGSAHNNLGKIALIRGDLASAVIEYAADDTIETQLSAHDPKNNDQRTNMFTVRAILGRTLALTGDVQTGMRDLQQAVDIATQVRANDPTETGVEENLALYQMQLSRLLRLSGELSKAHALTTQSLDTFSRLTRQEPANTHWQREFAEVQLEQATQSLAANDADKARTQTQAALGILDPLLKKQPDDRATLLATVNARLLFAKVTTDVLAAQQLRDAALKATQSVKSGGTDPRLLALQVEALVGLGNKAQAQPIIQELSNGGYRDLALLDVFRREGIDYPSNTKSQSQLQAGTNKKDRPRATQ